MVGRGHKRVRAGVRAGFDGASADVDDLVVEAVDELDADGKLLQGRGVARIVGDLAAAKRCGDGFDADRGALRGVGGGDVAAGFGNRADVHDDELIVAIAVEVVGEDVENGWGVFGDGEEVFAGERFGVGLPERCTENVCSGRLGETRESEGGISAFERAGKDRAVREEGEAAHLRSQSKRVTGGVEIVGAGGGVEEIANPGLTGDGRGRSVEGDEGRAARLEGLDRGIRLRCAVDGRGIDGAGHGERGVGKSDDHPEAGQDERACGRGRFAGGEEGVRADDAALGEGVDLDPVDEQRVGCEVDRSAIAGRDDFDEMECAVCTLDLVDGETAQGIEFDGAGVGLGVAQRTALVEDGGGLEGTADGGAEGQERMVRGGRAGRDERGEERIDLRDVVQMVKEVGRGAGAGSADDFRAVVAEVAAEGDEIAAAIDIEIAP